MGSSRSFLRTLLVVLGLTGLATREGGSEHLDAVANAHDRLNSLIEDILTLAREGDRVSVIRPVSLADMAARCWRNVETSDATIHTHFDQTIQADDCQLARLLESKIRNAVEHGGEKVKIITVELDEEVYLEEDGPANPEDGRSEVFDAGHSTGEGMAGVGPLNGKEVADAHGWNTRVTDPSNGGAGMELSGIEFAG